MIEISPVDPNLENGTDIATFYRDVLSRSTQMSISTYQGPIREYQKATNNVIREIRTSAMNNCDDSFYMTQFFGKIIKGSSKAKSFFYNEGDRNAVFGDSSAGIYLSGNAFVLAINNYSVENPSARRAGNFLLAAKFNTADYDGFKQLSVKLKEKFDQASTDGAFNREQFNTDLSTLIEQMIGAGNGSELKKDELDSWLSRTWERKTIQGNGSFTLIEPNNRG